MHVAVQYFTQADVSRHSEQTTARIEQVFRRRTQELIATRSSNPLPPPHLIPDDAEGGSTSSAESACGDRLMVPSKPSKQSSLELPKSSTTTSVKPKKDLLRGEIAVDTGLGNVNSAAAKTTSPVISETKLEHLVFERAAPYRKVIETLEAKLSHLESRQQLDKQLRKELAEAHERNRTTFEQYEMVEQEFKAGLAEIRGQQESVVLENKNLLNQLQKANVSIQENSSTHKELGRSVNAQKNVILLLEGKLKGQESGEMLVQNMRKSLKDEREMRVELRKGFESATLSFGQEIGKLKKDYYKLCDEKRTVLLRAEEASKHLESCRVEIDRLEAGRVKVEP